MVPDVVVVDGLQSGPSEAADVPVVISESSGTVFIKFDIVLSTVLDPESYICSDLVKFLIWEDDVLVGDKTSLPPSPWFRGGGVEVGGGQTDFQIYLIPPKKQVTYLLRAGLLTLLLLTLQACT